MHAINSYDVGNDEGSRTTSAIVTESEVVLIDTSKTLAQVAREVAQVIGAYSSDVEHAIRSALNNFVTTSDRLVSEFGKLAAAIGNGKLTVDEFQQAMIALSDEQAELKYADLLAEEHDRIRASQHWDYVETRTKFKCRPWSTDPIIMGVPP